MNRLVESPAPKISPAIAERRHQERIGLSTPVRILRINGRSVLCEAVCRNVSHGGICFETAATLEVGKVVAFEFVHAVDEPCRYHARVLYRHEHSYGAYYVNEDGSDIIQQN